MTFREVTAKSVTQLKCCVLSGRISQYSKVHPQVGAGLVQGHAVDERKAVHGFALAHLIFGRPPRLADKGHLLKQMGMVAFLDAQNVMIAVLEHLADVGSIRTQGIPSASLRAGLGDRKNQVRIVGLQMLQKPLGGIPFTIIFGFPVGALDGLRC